MGWKRVAAGTFVIAVVILAAFSVLAQEPQPWQLGMQTPASPSKHKIEDLHNLLLVITTVITIFVLGLLIYTMIRFRASANPKPSRVTHHTWLEVAWTVVPVIILLIIAIPSFKMLYFMDRTVDADMTLKVVGHQWYWSYEYPDNGDLKFDSYMIPDADLKPGQKRLLEVDNRLVVPVGATIRLLIIGTDVIHSWLVPALGVQLYAMPGRVNETWVRVERPGVYYGQCNQICGTNHAYMPIAIEAIPKEAFTRWVDEAKKKFAQNPELPLAVAAALR
ncbi:MAG: cytochrome c oxidase subunit II [Proteobacteria bacterium]|nr:cytochrome c oxidase subunit II [Pseudomonadota bacterium]